MVNPRFYWAVPLYDVDHTTVHLEAEDPTTGICALHRVLSTLALLVTLNDIRRLVFSRLWHGCRHLSVSDRCIVAKL